MIRLIYISTARTTLDSETMAAILATSRRNNQAVDVTGLLLVGGRRFLQVLEGPEDAVMQTYERIRRDDRHYAAVVLSRRAIEMRSFAGWAMGYQPAGTVHGHGEVADDVAAMIAPIGDAVTQAYFAEFARKHAAAAY
ncbi:BLUF domain-containing protein [Sphingomonas sp. 22R3R2A-7]|uniref:BLUF domain-containing protein n=1 Tax=Sphingomonas sp. 22R3R2A-7 TaxID=3050230 RepID=UPI002FE306E9